MVYHVGEKNAVVETMLKDLGMWPNETFNLGNMCGLFRPWGPLEGVHLYHKFVATQPSNNQCCETQQNLTMSDMNISKLKPIINLFIVNDIDFLCQKQKFQIM